MSRQEALDPYNKQPNDPDSGFISPGDPQASVNIIYDDMEALDQDSLSLTDGGLVSGPVSLAGGVTVPGGAAGSVIVNDGSGGLEWADPPVGPEGPQGLPGEKGERGDSPGVHIHDSAPNPYWPPDPDDQTWMWVDSDDEGNYFEGSPSGVWAQSNPPDPYQAPTRATWLWVDTDEEAS